MIREGLLEALAHAEASQLGTNYLASPARDGAPQKKGGQPEDARRGIAMMHNIPVALPKSTVEVISGEQARHLRDTCHFPRQRNISDHNVTRLAAAMRARRFVPGTQVFLCVLPDGTMHIVNGNHTLEAVYACDIPQVLTITKLPVANQDEAGEVYATFDIQKVRTWRDSMRAVGADEGIPMADKVLAAVRVIDGRFGSKNDATVPRVDQIARIEEYRLAAHMWATAIAGGVSGSTGMIKRAAVIAVALVGFRYQPSFANEFWSRIAQDDGLTKGMPEKALLHWLRNTHNAAGTSARVEHCKAVAAAWNAAWRGEQRDYIKPNSMSSFFMLGTPYANGLGE
jgi:hypothetical protein